MNTRDRIWYKHWEKGVPHHIHAGKYAHLLELIDERLSLFPNRIAFENRQHTLTYAELDQYSRSFATYLQQHSSLQPQDRILLMMPNVLSYPVALFGALRAGLCVVNTNPLYTQDELKHQLTDSGAQAIVVLDLMAHIVAPVLKNHPLKAVFIARLGDFFPPEKARLTHVYLKYIARKEKPWDIPQANLFKTCVNQADPNEWRPPTLQPTDLAYLQYTGGTTGKAKGAMLTHRNLIANILQAHAWTSGAFSDHHPATVITALPLYHIFATTANLWLFFYFGAHNRLIANPRDWQRFINTLQQAPFQGITGVSTLYKKLLETPGFDDIDFSPLRIALAGGMSLNPSVALEWHQRTGKPILQAYGLTETSPAVCITPLHVEEYNGSVGTPISSTDVSIRDEQGQKLPLETVGEIWVKGPQVMKGYWRQPEETAQVLSPEGWLKTGDLGIMDRSGFVTIKDRSKDVIVVSGFKVFPNEIEHILTEHPGVSEAAVVGVPDEESGHVPKAYIVKKDASLSEKTLLKYLKKHAAPYKVPKHIEFRKTLPMSSIGKPLRKELRHGNTP